MTIIYPSWEVSVERNRSALNIVSVTPDGTTQGSATEISSGYEYTVAVCPADNSGPTNVAVKLPDDALVGDAFEVHNSGNGASLLVFPPSGESIGTGGTNNSSTVSVNYGKIYRKTATGTWFAVGKE